LCLLALRLLRLLTLRLLRLFALRPLGLLRLLALSLLRLVALRTLILGAFLLGPLLRLLALRPLILRPLLLSALLRLLTLRALPLFTLSTLILRPFFLSPLLRLLTLRALRLRTIILLTLTLRLRTVVLLALTVRLRTVVLLAVALRPLVLGTLLRLLALRPFVLCAVALILSTFRLRPLLGLRGLSFRTGALLRVPSTLLALLRRNHLTGRGIAFGTRLVAIVALIGAIALLDAIAGIVRRVAVAQLRTILGQGRDARPRRRTQIAAMLPPLFALDLPSLVHRNDRRIASDDLLLWDRLDSPSCRSLDAAHVDAAIYDVIVDRGHSSSRSESG
jgi:hypothetical protein